MSTTKCIKASAGEGRYKIQGIAVPCGNDLSIILCGGTKYHVGAVAIGDEKENVQSQVLASHRDDYVAVEIARRMIEAFHCSVSVSVGIHIDNASAEEIQVLVKNSRACCQILKRRIESKDRLGYPAFAHTPGNVTHRQGGAPAAQKAQSVSLRPFKSQAVSKDRSRKA